MALECPECSRWFKGNKCTCGYDPKNSSADSEERRKAREEDYQRTKARYESEWERKQSIDELKRSVLATVKQRGPRRWAYEIKALQEAGFYTDLSGIAMADKVIKMDEYRGEE